MFNFKPNSGRTVHEEVTPFRAMDIRIQNWLRFANEWGEDIVLASDTLDLNLFQKREIPIQPAEVLIPVQSPSLLSVRTLEELRQAIETFEGCALKKTALNTVFSDGDPHSPVVFVGEAPGAEEDKQGLPFVGQSGQLLNKMLEAISLARSDVYITNVVYWRPPGNRTPDPTEIDQCLPFLEKHLEILSPKVIVLLGATAMRAVLQLHSGLSHARGFWHTYTTSLGKKFKTMVTFHPSYLLRSPGQKMLAWQDFMMLDTALKNG